jgi:5-methylcytosine-specific restriction endonuclease McrA
MNDAALFCSDLCKDEAKFVRYFRACIVDGRYDQPDVQEALRIRLAHILGGGYADRERRLPQAVREAVIARAKGRCQNCGAPGNQIDHIRGSSSDLENLQVLCPKCHNEKTTAGFVKISPETHPEEWAKREALLARVHAPRPVRLCDATEWDQLWRTLLKARREALKGG